MRDRDIEWSFQRLFTESQRIGLANPPIAIHKPGQAFDPSKLRIPRWIEPRIAALDRRGSPPFEIAFRIRVFLVTMPKERDSEELSDLVDSLRALVDPNWDDEGDTKRCPSLRVLSKQTEEQVGILHWTGLLEARTSGTTVQVNGVSVSGLDVATLTVSGVLNAVPPGSC